MFTKKIKIIENKNNNNLKKSYAKKKTKHEPSGWAMLTKCPFDKKENKFDYCRRKDCIEKIRKKIKKRAMKIINYEQKEMIPLIYEENKSYKRMRSMLICVQKIFVWIRMMKIILIEKGFKITAIIQKI